MDPIALAMFGGVSAFILGNFSLEVSKAKRQQQLVSERQQRVYDAIYSGNYQAFREALSALFGSSGVPVDTFLFRDLQKRTFLHIAVMSRDLRIIKGLPLVRDLFNQKDELGYTPLHYAAMMYNSNNVMAFLLEQGCDKSMTSQQGYTTHDIVAGLWQDQRSHWRRALKEKLFDHFFTNGLDALLLKVVLTRTQDLTKGLGKTLCSKYFKKHHSLSKLLNKNPTLQSIFLTKMFMNDMVFPVKKSIDFKTFREPHFMCVAPHTATDLRWHKMPKQLPILDDRCDANSVCDEPLCQSSKASTHQSNAETKPEVATAQDKSSTLNSNATVSTQSDVVETESSSQSSTTIELLETNSVAGDTLSSFSPSRASSPHTSPNRSLFQATVESDDEIEESMVVLPPVSTNSFFMGDQPSDYQATTPRP